MVRKLTQRSPEAFVVVRLGLRTAVVAPTLREIRELAAIAALAVLLYMLLAAGLLRLSQAPTPGALAAAASVILVRHARGHRSRGWPRWRMMVSTDACPDRSATLY